MRSYSATPASAAELSNQLESCRSRETWAHCRSHQALASTCGKVPAAGIFDLPLSAIGARYRYILSPLLRLVPAHKRPRVFNLATPKRFSSRSHHRRPPQSDRAPITDRGREYTCSGHQSRKGRENIPLRLPRTPHGATALITATRYQSVYLFDCFVFARRHLSRNADAHLLEAEGGELLLPFLGSSVNRTFEPSQGPRGVVPATHPNVQTLELGT
eukprot:1953123-Pyramimonas_sp.AAC.1